jgi:CO dehydrogenase/acetyl-CoA synthase beta subunit
MKVWKKFNIDAEAKSPGELLKMLQEKIRKASGSEDSSSSNEDQEEKEEEEEEDSDQEKAMASPRSLSSRQPHKVSYFW